MPVRAAAAVALVVIGLSTARAAEPGTLTLACRGTATSPDVTPVPISMGVIVNFSAQTVRFGSPELDSFPVTIDAMNDVTISFSGKELRVGVDLYIIGRIDRVTGDMEAIYTMSFKRNTVVTTNYALKCRPAQRLF
jgi:hypothetical protein